MLKKWFVLALVFSFGFVGIAQAAPVLNEPIVRIETSMGDIIVKLFPDKAPITCKNFMDYIETGFYNGTIFHRVIDNFMIQGGGFVPGLKQKKTLDPIKNEASNGLKNNRGTLAMARTSVVDSATAQFFINLRDNAHLNFQNSSQNGFGYAVFGEVISGMDVVDRIAKVKVTRVSYYENVPEEDVVIKSMSILRKPEVESAKKTPTANPVVSTPSAQSTSPSVNEPVVIGY